MTAPGAVDSALVGRAPLVGIAGALVMAGVSLATALAYRGTEGQAYSPFNHWVSELGEPGVSSLASVFNVGVMIGGICFAIFMLGLARTRTGLPRSALGLVGAAAGLAGSLVGVFPIDTLTPHALAAVTFLNLAWLAVGLASLGFVRRPDPRFPRWLAGVGGFTFVAHLGFLVALAAEGSLGVAALGPPVVRKAFWPVSTLEWATLAGILAWVLLSSLTWRRARNSVSG